MNYTKEIYDRLSVYRGTLYNACYLDYVRLTNIEQKKELAEIYKSHFKKDSDIMNGCSRCLLRDCKTLGKIYFEDEKVYKELELKEKAVENQPLINNEVKKATNNGKKGRKPKTLKN